MSEGRQRHCWAVDGAARLAHRGGEHYADVDELHHPMERSARSIQGLQICALLITSTAHISDGRAELDAVLLEVAVKCGVVEQVLLAKVKFALELHPLLNLLFVARGLLGKSVNNEVDAHRGNCASGYND